MNSELQSQSPAPSTARHKPRLGGLFAEFKKLSPSLEYECSEDEARHRWASEVLRKPVASWNALIQNEVNRLIKVAREQSGDGPAYRAMLIARMAVRLWGSDWDAFLRERLQQRFGSRKSEVGNRENPDFQLPTSHSRLYSLTPAQAHEMIEEVLSRIAREEGIEIEELRREIRKQKSEARSQEEKRNG